MGEGVFPRCQDVEKEFLLLILVKFIRNSKVLNAASARYMVWSTVMCPKKIDCRKKLILYITWMACVEVHFSLTCMKVHV